MSNPSKIYDDQAASKIDPPEPEIIFNMLRNGQLEAFKHHRYCIDLEERNMNGDTFVHVTISNCNRSTGSEYLNKILFLLHTLLHKAPQLTRAKNNAGETPLLYACKLFAHAEVIKFLIYFDSEVACIPDDQGMTPLHCLAGPKFYKIHRDNLKSTLIRSGLKTIEECLELAQLLIDYGAHVNAEDIRGINPLQYSVDCHKKIKDPFIPMIELLLENEGSFISTKGTHAIKFTKSIAMTKILMKIDPSDINILDENNKTPLHYIIDNSRGFRDESIYFLLENHAIVEEGTDPIALAERSDCSFDIIDLLLELYPGYDVNTRYENGMTLLIHYGKTIDIVKRLLYLGADASLETHKSMNAIFTALDGCDDKAVMKLLDAGANPLVYDSSGINALIQICIRAEKDIIDFKRWTNLIKYYINHCKKLRLVPSKPMTEIYIEAFLCLYIAYNTVNKDKITCIIKAFLEADTSFLLEPMIYSLPDTMSYKFKENTYECIAYLLVTISSKSEEFPVRMKEFLHILFDIGFNVCNTPTNCVTPLTALLAFKNNGNEDIGDEAQYYLAEEIIVRGVNVESIALQIRELREEDGKPQLWNSHSTEIARHMLYLPDALLLAFLNKRINILEILLPFWWGPPLGLFMFTASPVFEDMVFWFSYLSKFGPIPQGTQMFIKVKAYLKYLYDDALQHGRKECKAVRYYEKFHNVHKSPVALRDLAKYAVRKSFAAQAMQPMTSLPVLLKEHVPPNLRYLSTHLIPELLLLTS